jgi:peptidoglycan lytic transglycosylase
MNNRLQLTILLSCLPFVANAETMIASHYRAKAPQVAAHRSLPMGTRLMLTNPRTGRTAHVIIRDRGPFIRGRALDISSTVASRLGFGKSGVLPLTAQVIRN